MFIVLQITDVDMYYLFWRRKELAQFQTLFLEMDVNQSLRRQYFGL